MTATLDFFLQLDRDIFIFLNSLHAPWADTLMYWFTNKYTWIPMYVFLLWVTIKNEKRRSIAIVVTVLSAVIIADKITSGVMKPYFMRLRPCHDPTLDGIINVVGGCGGLYGFASSHASTSFSLAIVWYTLLKNKVSHMGWLLIWAACYSYSRIYVAAHYPGDILVGAVVGLLSGWVCIKLYRTFLEKYYPN